MKIELKIHANCSEWDLELENEDYIFFSDAMEEVIKEEIKKDWDV